MAFDTLCHNLIDSEHGHRYDWPEWFPKGPCTTEQVATSYREHLQQLRGQVTMVVGGPPCQGFSIAGRRNSLDHRNSLFDAYMQIVRAVEPLYILLENVQGITMLFDKERRGKQQTNSSAEPYSQRIIQTLQHAGYDVKGGFLKAADYGVPQLRPRYFLIGARREFTPFLRENDPFAAIASLRQGFLLAKGLPLDRPVSVKEAISDLETIGNTVQSSDSPRFMQGKYSAPASNYQHLMRTGIQGCLPDSHRLANHRPDIRSRFEEILETCRRGVQLSQSDRARFGLKKHCTIPLAPDQPSRTLTTLPDDIIHYLEPRILTVREYARLQSIPDWFQFLGAYTTGGHRRVQQCPRYTQAGNAVPPFVGEVVGSYLATMHDYYVQSSSGSPRMALQPIHMGTVDAGVA